MITFIQVIVAAGISYGVNLSDRYQVKIIDNIPPGFVIIKKLLLILLCFVT